MSGAEPSAPPGESQAPAQALRVLTEGKARISQQGNEVFFNPAQVVNRDVSIAVLNHFSAVRKAELESGKLKRQRPAKKGGIIQSAEASAPRPDGLRLLEGLAATGLRAIRYASEGLAIAGLRAIRYASEVQGIARVDANDLDPTALEAMKRNLELTGEPAASRVHPMQGDARLAMLQQAGLYDAVDLDPYGSPSHFLDSAVQAVAEGGLLLVTATDMAVLCGNNGEACWAKYGSYPLHKAYCHEQALRILLASIESHANRYRRHIVPVLSLSIDFYVRVFVRVYTSPQTVKDSPTKLAYLFQSRGCDSFHLQSVGRKNVKGNSVSRTPGIGPVVPQACEQTGSTFSMGGPLWSQPLHDPAWVAAVHKLVQDNPAYPAHKKVASVLTSVAEELQDVPLYYDLHALCKTVHCSPPPADILRSAIVNAGFRVSGTHASPLGLKTDCPPASIWDIIRSWVALHPVTRQLEPGSPAAKILATAPAFKADFARAAGAISAAKASKTARFLPNPEANWGPKPKHGRIKAAEPAAPCVPHASEAQPAQPQPQASTAAPISDAIPCSALSPPQANGQPAQPGPALGGTAAQAARPSAQLQMAAVHGARGGHDHSSQEANGEVTGATQGDAEMADAEQGSAPPKYEAILELLGDDGDPDQDDW